MPRLPAVSLIGLALTLTAACSDPVSMTPPTLEERLSSPGEYSIGFARHDVSYMTPEGAEERQLPVAIWYPTSAVTTEPTMYTFRESLEVSPDATPSSNPS